MAQHRQHEPVWTLGVHGRVDNHHAGQVGVFFGEPQRQRATHRQSHHEYLVAAFLQVGEDAREFRVPILPTGLVHLLPGRPVAGQPGEFDRVAGRREFRPKGASTWGSR
jgi:hypothetical protein